MCTKQNTSLSFSLSLCLFISLSFIPLSFSPSYYLSPCSLSLSHPPSLSPSLTNTPSSSASSSHHHHLPTTHPPLIPPLSLCWLKVVEHVYDKQSVNTLFAQWSGVSVDVRMLDLMRKSQRCSSCLLSPGCSPPPPPSSVLAVPCCFALLPPHVASCFPCTPPVSTPTLPHSTRLFCFYMLCVFL